MQVNNQSQLVDELVTLFRLHQNKSLQFNNETLLREEIINALQSNLLPDQSAETKNISILLSDLRGFTAMSEKYSPLIVIELLNRYFSKMSEIIDQHHGVIDKFMGDSIMVLFGAIENSADDLTNAITCAIEMQIAMNDINQISESLGMAKLYMGIGINTGEVVAGTLGSDIYREYTVIGDEVNLVSRVEAHSLRGQILLTENSYQLAKHQVEIGDINEAFVKGKTKPIKMYELIAFKGDKHIAVPCRDIRRSPRVTSNAPFEYQIVDNKTIKQTNYSGMVIDISYGGLYAKLSNYIDAFTEIKMQVSLAFMGNSNSDIYARVLSCRAIDDYYETHVEFTALDEKARLAIKSYVDQLI